jgi:hypothetical protein
MANKVYDRVPNWAGGMDAYKYPADLLPNQSQLLQNMVVLDNGRAVTRAGADQVDSNPSTFSRINPAGAVQGMAFLDNANGQFILQGQGGKLYSFNGTNWSNALAFNLTNSLASVAMCQGIDKLLISDGVQAMQLWDGANFTACSTGATDTNAKNAPTGVTAISYIAGMFVCAGAAMQQGTGTGVQTFPSDALVFSNYTAPGGAGKGSWNNATNSFRVGNGNGEAIVALAPIQSTASSSPIFNLAVLKENSVWVVGIYPGQTTAEFAAMFTAFQQTPQGDQVGTGIGCVGRNAWCSYQDDLLFMSQDGVQSLQRMQAAAGQYKLTSPLSTPVQPYIDRINWAAASGIQAIKYRHLAIFFVPLDNSTTNNYGLVWDGRIGQWMIWTGWTPSAAVITRYPNGLEYSINGNHGLTQSGIQLVLGNSDGSITVWKDYKVIAGQDNTYLDNGKPIVWQVNTRSMVFGSLDFQKKLQAALIRFNQGNAKVNFSAWLDLADSDDWAQTVKSGGVILPVILPFVLGSAKPTECYRRLEGLSYCNEFYLSFGAAGGWADVRNLSVSAFMKPIKDPAA